VPHQRFAGTHLGPHLARVGTVAKSMPRPSEGRRPGGPRAGPRPDAGAGGSAPAWPRCA
jgi:hypothetical protein